MVQERPSFLRLIRHSRNTDLAVIFTRRLASTGASQIGNANPGSAPRNEAPPTAATAGQPHVRFRLPLDLPAFSIWGANTNVGKTLVSVGLAHAAAARGMSLSYVKPVQTGFPGDSDARLVALACDGQVVLGAHAAATAALGYADDAGDATASGGGGVGTSSRCTTLFAWRNAVSPHLAVRLEGRGVSDEELVASTAVHVRQEMDALLASSRLPVAAAAAAAAEAHGSGGTTTTASAVAAPSADSGSAIAGVGDLATARNCALLLLETAGGVTSPAPSGRLMVDVLRPLRPLSVVLVGDPRLGGIAATLSAYDSLVSRGWDVEAVVLLCQHAAQQGTEADRGGTGNHGGGTGGGGGGVPLDNLSFIREHFSGAAGAIHRLGAPPPEVVGVPACPPPPPPPQLGYEIRNRDLDPNLRTWLVDSLPTFTELLAALQCRHQRRLGALLADRAAAEAQLWWPFTQHAGLTHGSATIVDGRWGETWTALAPATPAAPPALVPLYDASSSWWTQAATPILQPEIARAVSYAAGRYLHVLFAEVAHEPALRAAAALLMGPGAGWADRVFFSDDGSTAVEVALKMAFRKFLADRGELQYGNDADGGGKGGELLVLGLQGAYHGDTLGAQDCVAPSVFNGPLQSPWYRGRGLFLQPPYVGICEGRWRILDPIPSWLSRHYPSGGALPTWASFDDVLSYSSTDGGDGDDDGAAGASALTATYLSYIEAAIDEFEAAAAARPARLAACIMEPLVQGAGGMLVVEPGFQRAVANVCRRRRLPVVLDEVFSGLYRLGTLTAAAALGILPDIACYGKLLTGGAVPLAATLATREVFQAFSGPSKLFALLHGHSYTAHPIGCAAAAASLQLLSNADINPNICAPCRCPKNPTCAAPCGRLLPLWDEQLVVSKLSYHPLVSRVAVVGTLMAVELAAAAAATATVNGCGSGATAGSVSAVQVVRKLRDSYDIYARPLGQVVYLMVPPTSRRETAAWLTSCLKGALDACMEAAGSGSGRGGGRGGAVEEAIIV